MRSSTCVSLTLPMCPEDADSSWVVDEDIVLIAQCGYMEGAENNAGIHMCLLAIFS